MPLDDESVERVVTTWVPPTGGWLSTGVVHRDVRNAGEGVDNSARRPQVKGCEATHAAGLEIVGAQPSRCQQPRSKAFPLFSADYLSAPAGSPGEFRTRNASETGADCGSRARMPRVRVAGTPDLKRVFEVKLSTAPAPICGQPRWPVDKAVDDHTTQHPVTPQVRVAVQKSGCGTEGGHPLG